MKYCFTPVAFLLFLSNTVLGQYIEKNWFNKSDAQYGFYTSIKPSSSRIQAVLVLLDSYGGNADNFLSETKIHNVASANDILTICIPTGERLYIDSSMIGILNRILKETRDRNRLRPDQFVIGGKGHGGTIALRYVELANQSNAFPVQFKTCFVVDSPLDLARLYQSSETDIRKNTGGWWTNESKWLIQQLGKELGDPNKDLKKFEEVSPFVRAAKDTSNEKVLKSVAIRTYYDVDVNWHLQNRNRSLYETDMLDGSELISRLIVLGNKNAEFVAAKQPGRKSDGSRQVHSWNLVDEIELVQWLKEKMNFYPDHLAIPFTYPAPAGWAQETILFPFDFAPSLAYSGFEKLWFAPGWGNPNSNEKWAYTLLWWLDGNYSFDEKIIKKDLESYFSGLTGRRATADKLDQSQFTPATIEVKKIETFKGDKQTYIASANIFDAQVTKKPAKLYFKIHVKDCQDKSKTIVLIEAAGSQVDQPAWKMLDKINEDFSCGKL